MSRIDKALRRALEAGVQVPAAPTAPDGIDGSTLAPPWPEPGESAVDHPEPAAVEAPAASSEPISATAPPVNGRRAGFEGFAKHVIEKLIVASAVPAASVEQYRKLAATLHHAQSERNIKLVMVSSAMPAEGKTLTATNLALTLSQSYRRRVLLIDGDLRRPRLHELFQVPNAYGLSDALNSDTDRRLSIIQVSGHLSLLTGGRPEPDPMAALTSERMRRILDEAVESFDWVVIDTPPVGVLPDGNLLAAMVDVAVLVVWAGRTPFEMIQQAVDAIGRERVIGVVLNRVEAEAGDSRYDYVNRYYPAATIESQAEPWSPGSPRT